MDRKKLIEKLNEKLLGERPELARLKRLFPDERRLLRALMNTRPPTPISPDFLATQDELLSLEREEKGVVEATLLPVTRHSPKISLWQGDITRIRADAIVNAANSDMLGCFCPCHGCIDNAIHSASGLQLREECHRLMEAQGHPEPTGRAKITGGYNLPASHVLHTVGPIIVWEVTEEDRAALASCYTSCLELAAEKGLKSVAFCCISTGEFRFPNDEAAKIAVKTVDAFLQKHSSIERVVFNVFKDSDRRIYRDILGEDIPS